MPIYNININNMKIYKNLGRAMGVLAIASLFTFSAHAANVPNMSLYSVTSGSSQVQITVFGADPNASVLLYYPGSSSLTSTNIGTTTSGGYLTTTADANTYGIASGASVYVMVDGQSSQASLWPSFTSSGTLPLSQTSLTLVTGQSQSISASFSAALSLSTNTNPSVATASISGNQITVTAFNAGTTNLTICASGLGCATVQVTVQSSATAANISFSQSNVTVAVGQSQTVAISGSGTYYVSSNANSGFVSANLNGSILTIGGVNPGSSVISVCSSSNGTTSCGSVNVTVTQSTTSTTATTNTTTPLTFTPSNVTMTVGQTQSVNVIGGTSPYYVSANSASSVATANVNGSSVTLTGLAFGGDNITICSINGQCGILYDYVSSNPVNPAATVSTTVAPAIASFSVSSNDQNGSFLGAGNALTLTFTANQSISIPTITVAGAATSVSGNGNGPYTASYAMTGNESLPIPVKITFSNPAGSSASASFWLGSVSGLPDSSIGVPVSSGGIIYFNQYLYNGSTGSQVTALQKRLTADGLYSGPITGTFGDLTEAGVKAYQKKYGLDQLGVVGPATRTLLNEGK